MGVPKFVSLRGVQGSPPLSFSPVEGEKNGSETAENKLVGWVEASCADTHLSLTRLRVMGIASLHPSYISQTDECRT